MWVYGDRVRSVARANCLAEIDAGLNCLDTLGPGIVRHAALVTLLLQSGELAQAMADDAPSHPAAHAAFRLTRRLATAVVTSWRTGFAPIDTACVAAALAELADSGGSDVLRSRIPEGFAFYAVYPEAYADMASALGFAPETLQVIGVRSIGTVLAAVVAQATRAHSVCTVRPTGPPFARTIDACANLLCPSATDAIVVDEGPGASGSSFAAVADWLEACGHSPARILFMPSHAGPPGPMGAPAVHARWARTRQVVASFDERLLPAWFADLVGPAIAPLTDISGGSWRMHVEIKAPCVPRFERRKFLLRTASGTWHLKFVGLGRYGQDKFDLARQLFAAGFTAEPLGIRHGFLIEPWHHAARTARPSVDQIGRYLGFRARHCPAGDADGASLATLCDMARHNTRHLGIELRLDATLPATPYVKIDGRLHAWEWLSLPDGQLLKADALDHHAGHDLIGCQPIAWDLAGAIVEFDLSPAETEALRRIVAHDSGRPLDPQLIPTFILCYCAFQLGLWDDTERADVYARRLSAPPCRP